MVVPSLDGSLNRVGPDGHVVAVDLDGAMVPPRRQSATLGNSADDIEHFIEVLSDPDTIIGTPVVVTVSGQRGT